MRTVAALFVEENGVYSNLPGVDVWGVTRDARLYAGPHPVVCHSPCQRWGRYHSGGPNPNAKRRELGDDDGCFESALASVRKWGGVLEHPEASHAFKRFDLGTPPRSGGWVGRPYHWTCCVEQGGYGHPARKATWLYAVTADKPVDLIWGPSAGRRLDEGFHSKTERDAARTAGQKPVKRLSTAQNLATPIPFRDLLISIARSATPQREAA